jgi:pilus assembly protein CpaB
MLAGALLAGTASMLVFNAAHSAQASTTEPVSLTNVVVATKDIPEYAPITADAVTIKAFPSAFVGPGTVLKPADVIGKYATAPIVHDQLVLNAQVSPDNRMANLSARIPAGKVAYWLPLPDLMAQSGGVRAGDRIDILLTLGLTPPGTPPNASAQQKTLTAQNTLQNVEVFFVGTPDSDVVAKAAPAGGNGQTAATQVSKTTAGATSAGSKPTPKVIVFLLDPQDALLLKYMKDSGGTIDLVLRSRDSHDPAATEPVTAETLATRFSFRVQ